MAPSDLKIVFGAMTIGKPNTLSARVHSVEGAVALLDTFQGHGYSELDTARMYGDGSSEEILGALDWQKRNIVLATKLYPNAGLPVSPNDQYSLRPADVRRGFQNCLKALQADKIDMFYLHGPDRKTPFEDTLSEVDKLHREGLFNRFGLSNFMSWEVAQICEICQRNGWIQPTVYQGVYHTLQRTIEAELLPCLKYYGISLYAFQPLAGGFLTGRYTRGQQEFEPGSRFDPSHAQGKQHQGRYWNETTFDALDIIRAAAEKHSLTIAEVAMRWLRHHSLLKRESGDAIIIGASSVKHLEDNLNDVEKGPLPEDVLEALDQAWLAVKGVAPKYWH